MGKIQKITQDNIERSVKRELKHWEQVGKPKTETEVRRTYTDLAQKMESEKKGKIHNE
jgi:hypothetical protein